MRLSSCGLLVALVALAIGCDAKKSPPSVETPSPAITTGPPEKKTPEPKKPVEPVKRKVDLTATVNEVLKDLNANAKNCKAKYHGKWVEVEGRILSLNILSFDLGFSLWADETDLSGAVTVRLGRSDKDRFERMKALSRSQRMTVRGRMNVDDRSKFIELLDAELVKAAPNPALPATVEELLADFAKPQGQKKLTEVLYDVVLRAEVHSHSKDSNGLRHMVVGDPGKKQPTMMVSLAVVDESEGKKWGEIKPGEVIILIGEGGFNFESSRKVLQLRGARILTAPPEGVTLPAAKK